MDAHEFGLIVAETMEAVRESLLAIELAAQADDQPTLHALSRAYASTVAPFREYLAGLERGRPMPRALGSRILETVDQLLPLRDQVRGLGLHPDVEELRQMALLASEVSAP